MEHLVKHRPQHCRLATGEELIGEVPTVDQRLNYLFGLDLPHELAHKDDILTMIFPADRVLQSGDQLVNEFNKSVIVTEILERRKARGDWSKNPFDTSPDFAQVRFF